ncbi:hypothetical protein [Pseudomonas sp. H1h]|uniref:hypothetical protein n=1 Tax=Pseudomonas sp. H1h TaxID=1397280 RepID=UPI00046AA7C1|nr:hypothetical protein [Pseudomonas sp. H1h]
MKHTTSTLIIASVIGFLNPAHAEGVDPAVIKSVYDTGRNGSGLINYCVDKGFLKSDSTESAKKMNTYLAGLPGVDTRDGEQYERYGRKGKIKQKDGKIERVETAPQGVEAWCKGADEGLRRGLKSVGL